MKFLFIIFLFVALSCSKNTNIVYIDELYQTSRDEGDNIDSPTFWSGNDTLNFLISTAKETDKLFIHNAIDGKLINTVGSTGNSKLQFERPNGIFAIDTLLFVVERDNKRVQVLSLPSFNFLTFIGDGLVKPYGIFVYKPSDNNYRIYVTDNYELNDTIPPDKMLDKRVHIYEMKISNSTNVQLIRKFGNTSGNGRLKVVESIFGDPNNDNLFIAEEYEPETSVKVYDMNGKYKNIQFGLDIFKYQVEGIMLHKFVNGDGFWIVTDQSMENNIFHLFDRKSFKHIGAFSGKNTLNTDGIWLADKKIGNFNTGLFFAVHNDGNVSAFDFEKILDIIKN